MNIRELMETIEVKEINVVELASFMKRMYYQQAADLAEEMFNKSGGTGGFCACGQCIAAELRKRVKSEDKKHDLRSGSVATLPVPKAQGK